MPTVRMLFPLKLLARKYEEMKTKQRTIYKLCARMNAQEQKPETSSRAKREMLGESGR